MLKKIKLLLVASFLLTTISITNEAFAACELTKYRGSMHFHKVKLKDKDGKVVDTNKLEFAGDYNGETPLFITDKTGRFSFEVDLHARTLNKPEENKHVIKGGTLKAFDHRAPAPNIDVQARATVRKEEAGLYISKYKGGSKTMFADSIMLLFSCS